MKQNLDLNLLQKVVDELIKDHPVEARVRESMLAAGLSYNADPIERMTSVLNALEIARGPHQKKGPEHGSGL